MDGSTQNEMSPTEKLDHMRQILNMMVEDLGKDPFPVEGGRERALVVTKMQEARLWAGEALNKMGFYEATVSSVKK